MATEIVKIRLLPEGRKWLEVNETRRLFSVLKAAQALICRGQDKTYETTEEKKNETGSNVKAPGIAIALVL